MSDWKDSTSSDPTSALDPPSDSGSVPAPGVDPGVDPGAAPGVDPSPDPDSDPERLDVLSPPPALRRVGLPELPEDCGIRETLLWRFEDGEDEAALRRLGSMLTELVDESGQFGRERFGAAGAVGARGGDGPGDSGDGTRTVESFSLPREELRAVALDLFYSAQYLSDVAAERFASDLTREEARLAESSEHWAAQTTVIAAFIWEALEEARPEAPS